MSDRPRDHVDAMHEVRLNMNTAFLLMAQYDGQAVIPVELVCRDYFRHLTPEKLVRKVSAGEIAIPLVRMERSLKCAKGVHLQDLADYIDRQRALALKEHEQLHGRSPQRQEPTTRHHG